MMLPQLFSRILISLLLLASTSVYAQVSGLKGQILDKDTQETLAGATITIVGTNHKAISDLDGNFAFENLGDGSYKIQVDYISYGTVILNPVEISDNKIPYLKIQLEQMSQEIPKETELLNSKRLVAQHLGVSSI